MSPAVTRDLRPKQGSAACSGAGEIPARHALVRRSNAGDRQSSGLRLMLGVLHRSQSNPAFAKAVEVVGAVTGRENIRCFGLSVLTSTPARKCVSRRKIDKIGETAHSSRRLLASTMVTSLASFAAEVATSSAIKPPPMTMSAASARLAFSSIASNGREHHAHLAFEFDGFFAAVLLDKSRFAASELIPHECSFKEH